MGGFCIFFFSVGACSKRCWQKWSHYTTIQFLVHHRFALQYSTAGAAGYFLSILLIVSILWLPGGKEMWECLKGPKCDYPAHLAKCRLWKVKSLPPAFIPAVPIPLSFAFTCCKFLQLRWQLTVEYRYIWMYLMSIDYLNLRSSTLVHHYRLAVGPCSMYLQ